LFAKLQKERVEFRRRADIKASNGILLVSLYLSENTGPFPAALYVCTSKTGCSTYALYANILTELGSLRKQVTLIKIW
jgi:hypothetical protein